MRTIMMLRAGVTVLLGLSAAACTTSADERTTTERTTTMKGHHALNGGASAAPPWATTLPGVRGATIAHGRDAETYLLGGGFVRKYDGGELVWAKPLTDFFSGSSTLWYVFMAADGAGNVVISANRAGPGGAEVVKVGPSGDVVWARPVPGFPTAITTNAAGNVIVAGSFGFEVDFGGGPLSPRCPPHPAPPDCEDCGLFIRPFDVFIAVYDGGGAHVRSARYGHDAPEVCTDTAAFDPIVSALAADGDDLIVSGVYEGAIDFGGGPLVANGRATRAMFVAGLGTSDGAHRFSRGVDGFYPPISGDLPSGGLAVAPHGVALVGRATMIDTLPATIDFGGGPLAGTVNDIVVAKLDRAGNHVFSHRFAVGSAQSGRAEAVAMDPAGGVLITGSTGRLGASVNVGGDDLVSARGAAFVARYDAAGAHVTSRILPHDEEPGRQPQVGTGLAAATVNGAVMCGELGDRSTIDLGGGPLMTTDRAATFLGSIVF